MEYEELLNEAKLTIGKLEHGKQFVVKDLFMGAKWESLSNGDKKGFGRYFSKALREGELPSIEHIGETKAHHNKYIKI